MLYINQHKSQSIPTVHFVTQTQRNPTKVLRIKLWSKPPTKSEMKPSVRNAWSGPKAAQQRVGKQDWHWENHLLKWYKPKWVDCLLKQRNKRNQHSQGDFNKTQSVRNNIQRVQDIIQTHSTSKTPGNSDQFTRKTNNRYQPKMILKLIKNF